MAKSETALLKMELGLISSRKRVQGEAQVVTDLFKNGLMIFHLRKNHYSKKKYKQFIQKIPKEFHNRIVIHNYHILAFKYKLKGVHFSTRQLIRSKKTFLRLMLRIFRSQVSLSRGFDNLSDLISNKGKYEFVVLNPVFDSVSDDVKATAFSAKAIQSSVENSKFRVFALGGVKIENIDFVMELGFKGAILNSPIWDTEGDRVKAFKKALHEVERLSESGVVRRIAI